MCIHSLDTQPAHFHLWLFVAAEWFLNEMCERNYNSGGIMKSNAVMNVILFACNLPHPG